MEHAESDHKKAEEESRRLASVVLHSRELVNLATPNGMMVFLNDAGKKMLGISDDDIAQTNIMKVIPEHLQDKVRWEVVPSIERDGHWEGDLQYLNVKTGGLTDVHAITFKIADPETGALQFLANVSLDISDRNRAKEALLESEAKYRSIFENAVEGIFQTSPEGQYISVNPALARMIGYASPEELIKGVTDLSKQGYVNPEDRVRYKKILEEQGIVQGFETQHYKKDGSIIWVLINGHAVKDEAGKTHYYEGTIEDITSRKWTEELLRLERQRFSILIENAPFGMAMIDKDGNFVYINPKFKEIFGYNLLEIPDGRTWFKKTYPDPAYRQTVISAWVEDLKGARSGEKRPRIFTVTCRDGTEKIINFIPVQMETGVHLMACEDITSRKLAEESFQQTMEKLRKSLTGTIQVVSMTVEARDPYTAGHQRKVSNLARTIAQEMGLSSDTIDNIRMAGIIHDIGKISVPAEILSKPGILTDIEMSLIKVHSQSGYDILKDAGLPYPIAEIVLQHHERLDGSGYPQGLKDNDILLEAKIISVADVVEAIDSYRPYRLALGLDTALEEIEKNKGILYDAGVVEACLKLFREKGFSFEF
ncbi:MAG: PAS domain S-box protein [Proteobacteria bacterium]|nr:PAS domain S-box protein [Pseudomonadota bacterium]